MHLSVNQASTCLPPPVPRGDRQRTRCPPQPGSHRLRAPKAASAPRASTRHQATGDDEGPRGRRHPANPPLARGTRGRRPFLSLAARQRRERCVRQILQSRSAYRSPAKAGAQAPRLCSDATSVTRAGPGPRLSPGNRAGFRSSPAIYRAPPSWRPRTPKTHPRLWCSPLTQRIVPDEARITTLSVVSTPSRRRLTPSSSEPAVTPVAAKIASPFTRSSSS